MADKITTENILAIGFEYTDSETAKAKTVYLKVPNPKNNLTEQEIKDTARGLISDNSTHPILLTPQGEPFDSATAIATAYTEITTKRELDIGIE